MNNFKMLLPVDSKLLLGKKRIPITSLTIKKDDNIKKFKIGLMDHKEVVYENKFSSMTIDLEAKKTNIYLKIKEGNKEILISGRKFLSDDLLKEYLKPLIV